MQSGDVVPRLLKKLIGNPAISAVEGFTQEGYDRENPSPGETVSSAANSQAILLYLSLLGIPVANLLAFMVTSAYSSGFSESPAVINSLRPFAEAVLTLNGQSAVSLSERIPYLAVYAILLSLPVMCISVLAVSRFRLIMPYLKHWGKFLDNESLLLCLDSALRGNTLPGYELHPSRCRILTTGKSSDVFQYSLLTIIQRFDLAILLGAWPRYATMAINIVLFMLSVIHVLQVTMLNLVITAAANSYFFTPLLLVNSLLPLLLAYTYRNIVFPKLLARSICLLNIRAYYETDEAITNTNP